MKQIAVIGVGYVGLVTAACFSDLGNNVVAMDISKEKIEGLKRGEMPIYEPGLEELVERNVKAKRILFTTSINEALKDAKFVFICVGTPSGVDGEADLNYVESAAKDIAINMTAPLIVINKSTVPVGTGDWVSDIIKSHQNENIEFSVVSCPEFLREGSAIADFMRPHRTVCGSMNKEAAEKVAQLHLPLRAPNVITDLRTAEMIKYASNAFLATKISFINEIANICEKLGADVNEVATGMGFDQRIGPNFLNAGLGYGGSCFPKDVKALAYMAEEMSVEPNILRAVMHTNGERRMMIVNKTEKLLGSFEGRKIGIFGLAFKPNTDDMRDAPSVDIIQAIQKKGGSIKAFDPVAMEVATALLPDVEMMSNAYEVAEDCDAVIVVTEWNEFKQVDLPKMLTIMKTPVVVDGRNIYEPQKMKDLGFTYRAVGRGYNSNDD